MSHAEKIDALKIPELVIPVTRDGIKLLAEACAKLGMSRDEWTRSTNIAAAAFNKRGDKTKKAAKGKKASNAEPKPEAKNKPAKAKDLIKVSGFCKLLSMATDNDGNAVVIPASVANAADWKSMTSNINDFGPADEITNLFEGFLKKNTGEDRKAAITRVQEEAGLTEDEVRASRAYFPKFPSQKTERAMTGDFVASASAKGNAPGTSVDSDEE
jgi:hypothetical protein